MTVATPGERWRQCGPALVARQGTTGLRGRATADRPAVASPHVVTPPASAPGSRPSGPPDGARATRPAEGAGRAVAPVRLDDEAAHLEGASGAPRTVALPARPSRATSSSTVARPSTRCRAIARSTGVSAASSGSRSPSRRPAGARAARGPRAAPARPTTIRASGPASRRNARHPTTAGSSRRPGTRYSPLPCSSAQAAVVSAPLRAPASTTTVASASPLISRLRRGKVPRVGWVSGGNSLTTTPPVRSIARASPRCAAG